MRLPAPTRLRGPRSLRLRLTVAVALATATVLVVTGLLVLREFARGLDDRTDIELRDRASSTAALASRFGGQRLLEVSGEAFAQLYARDGHVLASTRRLGAAVLLTPAQVRSARPRPTLSTLLDVPGSDDGVRVIAEALPGGGGVVAIAESRSHREQELARLARLLTAGLSFALLVAALIGYHVAGAALRPVDRIRRRAAQIGEAELAERLPQPGTGDELDRLATTLNDLLGRLAGALEHERRIVSDASHELRTPISVLRTRLDVALRAPPEATALRAVVEEARDDARRLAELADDLLVLARADQGRLPLRPVPLDAQDLLEETAARHAEAARAAGRPFEVRVDVAGGAVVLADPDRLAQALDNLVVNALRHGGGPIALIARGADPGFVELAVADRGPGFTAALLPRAFDRFAQGGGTGHDASGSGLGLAIVRALLTASGGRVRARNRPGGGAEVILSVPAA